MIQPLGNKILIRQKVDSEETTASGIIKATQEKRHPIGEVVAIGDKVETVAIGDTVLFVGWDGDPISEELLFLYQGGEKNFLIIGIEKIIAKVI